MRVFSFSHVHISLSLYLFPSLLHISNAVHFLLTYQNTRLHGLATLSGRSLTGEEARKEQVLSIVFPGSVLVARRLKGRDEEKGETKTVTSNKDRFMNKQNESKLKQPFPSIRPANHLNLDDLSPPSPLHHVLFLVDRRLSANSNPEPFQRLTNPLIRLHQLPSLPLQPLLFLPLLLTHLHFYILAVEILLGRLTVRRRRGRIVPIVSFEGSVGVLLGFDPFHFNWQGLLVLLAVIGFRRGRRRGRTEERSQTR